MEYIALIISVLAIIISASVAIWGWWRHRNIYDIERHLYFRKLKDTNDNKELKKKLNSGKYTVLHVGEYGGYIELILGKLKK